ncbi:hypothetical protein [Enterovirga rhinocerotis]|uniref:Lipoprotein n=1 Tax=Enterovirga rhinocerotis TaxID=1339210 RepID=A0A4R7C8Z2_9HYPH|nr:hypothetical protein [Enterovirga rhinocerotis]TDR94472.1 hypothetical protein EV668_1759 [Enterovirga rhinocerotis]
MIRRLRIALAAGGLAFVGACANDSFTYTMERYGAVKGVTVKLRCRDAYEVFDRYDARSLIVVTNPVSELVGGCLEGGADRAVRQREVARIYLEERAKRPLCRITRERDITGLQREFDYRCPDDPKAAPPRLQRG